jgi:hypothetical protein
MCSDIVSLIRRRHLEECGFPMPDPILCVEAVRVGTDASARALLGMLLRGWTFLPAAAPFAAAGGVVLMEHQRKAVYQLGRDAAVFTAHMTTFKLGVPGPRVRRFSSWGAPAVSFDHAAETAVHLPGLRTEPRPPDSPGHSVTHPRLHSTNAKHTRQTLELITCSGCGLTEAHAVEAAACRLGLALEDVRGAPACAAAQARRGIAAPRS